MSHFTPRRIIGTWRDGFALDLHTLSSVYLGDDEFGLPQFETQRSEMGDLLYRLKYAGDPTAAPMIADAACAYLDQWQPAVAALVPVPSSMPRRVPPVRLVAEAISQRSGLPLVDCVTRVRDVPQLKNVHGLDERLKLLEHLHSIDVAATRGKSVLLFDDLYRSGATMNAITAALYDQGGASAVFALTITQTGATDDHGLYWWVAPCVAPQRHRPGALGYDHGKGLSSACR